MRTIGGEYIEVAESKDYEDRARVIIEKRGAIESIYLTADELANHARECLAIAESMREMNRGEETRQAGPEGTEEISATRKADE